MEHDTVPVIDMDEPFARLHETPTSVVMVVGERAYKVKRPVRFAFADFTDRGSREQACRDELALNQRLAPDVYLGLGRLGCGEEPGEPMVVMRRLPGSRSLAHAIVHGTVETNVAATIARELVAFHESCEPWRGLNMPGSHAALVRSWEREAAEIEALGDAVAPRPERAAVNRLGRRFLEGRASLFARRGRDGWVREGHGDLTCDHVYLLDDGPRIIDRLDYDIDRRVDDVLADLAFLAMDLERLGALAFAGQLVRSYDELSGERHPPSLLEFHIARRALVRAKLATLAERPVAGAATHLFALARRHLEHALPVVTVVGGLPGSRRTTVASEVSRLTGAAHLSTDAVRAECFPDGSRYAMWERDEVYDELFRRAGVALAYGMSVVLDGTFFASRHRRAARELARSACAAIAEVSCYASGAATDSGRSGARPGRSDAHAPARAGTRRLFAPWAEATQVSAGSSVAEAAYETVTAMAQAVRTVAEGPRRGSLSTVTG